VTGVPNLAYIIFVASGAYTYAVLTVGPSSQFGGAESYIIGAKMPVVGALLIAVVVSGILGVLVGLTGLRRLRLDYQALALLIISFVAIGLVGADGRIFNGLDGMSLIPGLLTPGQATQSWEYVGIVAVACVLTVLITRRLSEGPIGRALRAVREDEDAALAIGKGVLQLRLLVQGVGAALAGLSGALLVGFIGGWSPSAWAYVETLALMTGIIVGGRGNNRGVLLGTVLVLGGLLQGVQYLPALPGRPGLADDLGWIIVGCGTIAFLFRRPQGLLPERRPRLLPAAPTSTEPSAGSLAAVVAPVRLPASAAPALPTAATASGPGAHSSNGLVTLEKAAVTPGAASQRANPRDSLLCVEGLVKRYGGVQAVDGVSLAVQASSITGLIGPNGAGKSTVLTLISGFTRPDAGKVWFDGHDVTSSPPYRRARRGLVRTFQLPHEFGRLTTIENLLAATPRQAGETSLGVLAGRRYWRADEQASLERARELLDTFGMTAKADDLAHSLSGGQKRMLEVMRALMARPRLLLLDEPMAGLSPLLASRLESICLQLKADGLAIILVEHELGAVDRLCDHVVVMAQGKVLSEGSMAELRVSQEVQRAYVVG
jgi:ABC-type branched-subunit amino acid transport system ATPase component/ABC-type branched-subunit amino acid transport system permease subunit